VSLSWWARGGAVADAAVAAARRITNCEMIMIVLLIYLVQ
jgi:hypothetical protein